MKIKSIIVFVFSSILVSGCMSAKVKIPPSEKTIKDVYEAHVGGGKPSYVVKGKSGQYKVKDDSQSPLWVDQTGYRKKIFVQPINYHQNPELEMLVLPHLTQKKRSIPAYIIPYQLFDKDEIRLPGE